MNKKQNTRLKLAIMDIIKKTLSHYDLTENIIEILALKIIIDLNLSKINLK